MTLPAGRMSALTTSLCPPFAPYILPSPSIAVLGYTSSAENSDRSDVGTKIVALLFILVTNFSYSQLQRFIPTPTASGAFPFRYVRHLRLLLRLVRTGICTSFSNRSRADIRHHPPTHRGCSRLYSKPMALPLNAMSGREDWLGQASPNLRFIAPGASSYFISPHYAPDNSIALYPRGARSMYQVRRVCQGYVPTPCWGASLATLNACATTHSRSKFARYVSLSSVSLHCVAVFSTPR